MLTRPQITTFALICRHLNASGDSVQPAPSILPKDIIRVISDVGFEPNSDLSRLLYNIAAEPNIYMVRTLLDKDCRLLMQSGRVKTASGDVLEYVTPYEAALMTCDHYTDHHDDEMVKVIASYFAKLPDGEKERTRQLQKYAPHFLNAYEGKNRVYYFGWIIDIIMRSSNADIKSALDMQFVEGNYLHDSLALFRTHFAARHIKSGLQFNYENLLEIAHILEDKYLATDIEDVESFNRFLLMARQIYGFVLRRLPGCDRQAFVHNIFSLVEDNKPLKRVPIMLPTSQFPASVDDTDKRKIGFDETYTATGQKCRLMGASPGRLVAPLRKLIGQKFLYFNNHLSWQPQQAPEQDTCTLEM